MMPLHPTLGEGERHVLEHDAGAEALVDVLGLEQHRATPPAAVPVPARGGRRRAARWSAPASPSGRTMTMTTNIRPNQSSQVSVSASQDIAGDEVEQHAEHRPPEADEPAADQHHHHDEARLVQAHHVRIGALLRHGEEPAGETRDGRREREDQPLDAPDVVADEARAHLVLADRLQDPAEGRVDEPPEEDGRQPAAGRRRTRRAGIVVQVDGRDAEVQRRTRDAEQPVLATGDPAQLDRAEPEDLPEGDGHQREIDAAPVRDHGADQRAGDGRGQHRGPEAAPEADRDSCWKSPKA